MEENEILEEEQKSSDNAQDSEIVQEGEQSVEDVTAEIGRAHV